MRTSVVTIAAVALTAVTAIGTTALAAPFGAETNDPVDRTTDVTLEENEETEPARPEEANSPDAQPTTEAAEEKPVVTEPALQCAEIDGTRVCDTFGEHDEGPGTTHDEPVFDCRMIDGTRVCDTFGEHDEGPGTRASAHS